MFSNPIKRLTDTLAQAQEQARQQRLKAQQPSSESKAFFDAENEEASFVNGDDELKPKESSEETASKTSEESKALPSLPAEKDSALPKEVRIKLAKLAKYEDRHPKLQAAYKESQGRIATFEKALRERTPLGSIDQIDDFGNYLNNLSVRTDMSLEELKRVTEAHNALKSELNDVREKDRAESQTKEKVIAELRKKIQDMEEEAAQQPALSKETENLVSKLKELEEALGHETALKTEIEELRQRAQETEVRVSKYAVDISSLEEIRRQKESLAASLGTLQTSLIEANQARKAAETALLDEKLAAKKRISELKEQNRSIQAELTNTIKPLNISTAAVVEPEAPSQNLTPTSPNIPQHDTSASANKKKKKKKKKVGAAAPTVSPQPDAEEQPAIITPVPAITPVAETQKLPTDNYALRLLEEYLSEIGKSLNTGPVGQELDDKVESLESKLSSFSVKMSLLLKQLEEANIDHATLTHRLREAENDIKSSREREDHLLDKTRRLESTSEDVEQLRDMLRDVGSDLVEAKDKIKEIEQREATAKSTKSDLEATIATLTKELNETRETAGTIEDVRAQAAIAESRAESLVKELNENKTKLSSVESDLVKLNAELATVSADKNDLTAKFADTQTKLRQIERSEKEARDRVASMQTSLISKEREISAIRSELTNGQNFKNQLEESVRTSRQDISRLESERRELQQREQIARDESTRFQRDATLYRDKITSLELLRATLTTERDTLTEEVQMKTAQLESTQSSMQNLREQTTEMGHRAREAKDRCEALDEELSEAHKLLSERAREAGTMRRLLDEAEGREAGRIKEAREKLEAAIEERDHLEEEITLLRRNNAEGSGELTKTLREKELAVKDLATRYEKVKKELDDLIIKKKDVEGKLDRARTEADEANSRLSKLSKSLEETTAQSQQLQQERVALKEAAEESQIRVDQLQRTQRHLSEELKRLKAAEKKTQPPPSYDSRASLVESRSPMSQTPRQSISSNGNDPSKAAIDKEYLRNVLVQFFEHKDKRVSDLVRGDSDLIAAITASVVNVIEHVKGRRDEVIALELR